MRDGTTCTGNGRRATTRTPDAAQDRPAVSTARKTQSNGRYVGIFTRGKSDRWMARLSVNGEGFSVNGYLTPKDAAVAYDTLVLHYRDAEWPRNFPRRALEAASAETLWQEQELRRQTDTRYASVRRHSTQLGQSVSWQQPRSSCRQRTVEGRRHTNGPRERRRASFWLITSE